MSGGRFPPGLRAGAVLACVVFLAIQGRAAAQFNMTCGNSDPEYPGTPWDCFPQLYNSSAANIPCTQDTCMSLCCFDIPINPSVDVVLVGPNNASFTPLVGTMFPVNITVLAMRGSQTVGPASGTLAAQNVSLQGRFRGVDILKVTVLGQDTFTPVEECKYGSSCQLSTWLRCDWPSIAEGERRAMQIWFVGADGTDTFRNSMRVTSATDDPKPENNKLQFSVAARAACCSAQGSECVNVVKDECPDGSSFAPRAACRNMPCATYRKPSLDALSPTSGTCILKPKAPGVQASCLERVPIKVCKVTKGDWKDQTSCRRWVFKQQAAANPSCSASDV